MEASGTIARVSWIDNSTNEDGFEIQRQKKSGKRWQPAVIVGQVSRQPGSGGTVTFDDTPGRGTFQYRVRAFNGVGTSEWTNWSTSVSL